MARDILSEYGPESPRHEKPRASSGGVKQARDVHNYSPPQGPTNINDPKGPGLHGSNYGHHQMKDCGYSSGKPGIGGDRKPHGTQR